MTWLNGVPYDTRDSPFLDEMKLSAAEYQTHSLSIANSHYDKDAAAEAKLRTLVDFCDAYAQWRPASEGKSSFSAAHAASWLPDNIDSDDEPVPAAAPAAAAAENAPAAAVAAAAVETKRPAPARGRRQRAAAAAGSDSDSGSHSDSDSSDGSSDDDQDSVGEEAASHADEAEYLPDRIIAKKTVAWRDFYLIHWLGYSAAERTWEPAPFFDQWCTRQTHEYEATRQPLRILALKVRPLGLGDDGKTAPEYYYEVQWQGRTETSMEREQLMCDEYPDAVKDWEQREQTRLSSRKHHLSAQHHLREQPATKRRRTGN